MHLTIGRLLKNAKAWALILTFLLFVLLRRKARCDFAREFKKLVTYLSNRMSTIGSYETFLLRYSYFGLQNYQTVSQRM